MADEKKIEKLGSRPLKNPQWELFCVLWAGNHSMYYFGHGQNCYAESFGYTDRIEKIERQKILVDDNKRRELEIDRKKLLATCRACSAELLTRPNISERVAYLIDAFLTNELADRELAYTIAQRTDLNAKVRAIIEYNRTHERVVEKVEQRVVWAWQGDIDDAEREKKKLDDEKLIRMKLPKKKKL